MTPEEESRAGAWQSPLAHGARLPTVPSPLTQAAGTQAVVGPRLRLGLVAVEDLLALTHC